MRKRNTKISAIKGIGIVLMVIGHAGASFVNQIYLFHMALFYFVSGYLFKNSHLNNKSLYIKRKIQGLYIPFIYWNILFLILHNLFVKIGIYTPEMMFTTIDIKDNFIKILCFISTEQLVGGYWFLFSIFVVSIIYYIISYIFRDSKNMEINKSIIIYLLFFINFIVLSKERTFSDSRVTYYYQIAGASISGIMIYHIGYLYKNKIEGLIEKFTDKYNILLIIVCMSFLFINSKFGSISMGSAYFDSPAYFILNSICGIYMCICIVSTINENTKIYKLLVYCGENTLIILALHMICFKIVNLAQIIYYKYPYSYMSAFPYINGDRLWWICYTIVGLFIPLGLCKVKDIFKDRNRRAI